jgi:zinc protease
MKKVFLTLGALVMTAVMALAQQPTREQLEAAIAQMPKIPATDQVRSGKLDNGLTYFIRHNELPAGRAEFYLATNVGAIQEEYPSQDGLAHFLEHMCFNGTEHFPDKAILDYLRSIGAEFGRNVNASTGFEETQYMLNNIPVTRESVVDSCLMILCDYSHFVLNEPKEIDAERGVIIEERRTRRNASWRSMEKSLPYYFGPDSRQAQTTLIGLQEHLETFQPESLVAFYQKWYHPGNQAVIVVGDVDVDRTEAKIKELFGAIPAKENPAPKPIQVIEDHDEPRVGILTDPENSNVNIEIMWHSEALPESINATATGVLTDLVEGIVAQVASERFTDITSKPGSPYLNGSFGFEDLIYEDIEAVIGQVALREDNILGGFKDYYTEILRLFRYGISDAEFNRAKADQLSYYETRANRASTRQNSEFIRPIISHFFDQEPLLEPQDEYEMMQMLLSQINATVVNQVLAQASINKNLVVVYNGPEKEGIATPTADQILAAMAEVEASDIAAPEGEEIPEAFLDPATLKGSAVAKTATGIYGSTEWTLGNGVKVIVYPTDYTKDQIIFTVSKDGGRSLIATEDLPSFESNVLSLFIQNSGVSQFSGTTVAKMLTGKTLSVTPYLDDLDHGLTGSSTVKDLETALQIAYLYWTDPRFDQEEWQNGIDQLNAVLPNLENQPNYKFQDQLYKTIYNDPRQFMVSGEVVAKANLATVEKYWREFYTDAAGTSVVFVGDIDVEALKPLVEKYFGSLPAKKEAPKWIDRKEGIVKGHVVNEFAVDMQTPKSTVYQIWSADMAHSYEKAAALEAISYILDIRYTNSLREEEGGTYGASTSASFAQRRPTPYVMILVGFDCKPALCDKLRQLAIDGIKDLAQNGPTDDEMNSAKLNLQKNLPESRQRNAWWRSSIFMHEIYGEDRNAAYEAAINALDKATLQKTLQEVLAQNNFVEVVMKPDNAAEAE